MPFEHFCIAWNVQFCVENGFYCFFVFVFVLVFIFMYLIQLHEELWMSGVIKGKKTWMLALVRGWLDKEGILGLIQMVHSKKMQFSQSKCLYHRFTSFECIHRRTLAYACVHAHTKEQLKQYCIPSESSKCN